MHGPTGAWLKEVRVKHAEERLKPPVLEDSRPVRVRSDRIPVSPPHPRKLLRVETDYFVAGALWEKIGGCWSCTKAAPIIKWMKGRRPEDVGIALLKMGARYEFLPVGHGQPHEVTA